MLYISINKCRRIASEGLVNDMGIIQGANSGLPVPGAKMLSLLYGPRIGSTYLYGLLTHIVYLYTIAMGEPLTSLSCDGTIYKSVFGIEYYQFEMPFLIIRL